MVYIFNKLIKLLVFLGMISGFIIMFFNLSIFPKFVLIILAILSVLGGLIILLSNRNKILYFTCFLFFIGQILNPLLGISNILISANFLYLALTISKFESPFEFKVVNLDIDKNNKLTEKEQINKKINEIKKQLEEEKKDHE